jgi:hypothetical protein
MLSLRLWRALDNLPQYLSLHRVLIPKQPDILPKFLLEFIGLSVFCLCTLLPFIILPIVMSFSCLNTALQIAVTLAHQRELERYDLLALTPIGALGSAIEISRFHTKETRENIEVARNFGGTMAVVVLVWGIILLIATFYGTQANVSDYALFTALVGFLLIVVALYHDCRQSLILGMVIGILAGSAQDRVTARLLALGSYLGIQLSLYALLSVFFILLAALLGRIMIFNMDVKLLVVIALVILCHFSAREIAIYLLWRHLNEDINDELPAQKSKRKA